VAVLTGCTGDGLPPAAEPPGGPPSAEPAGRTIEVGARPEGVVADSRTGLVAVGVRKPNALVLVDARTGRITDRTALPGGVRHLQLARPGGPVLVPVEGADTLLTVELSTGRIDTRASTGNFPHDATAATNGLVFVSAEFDHSVGVFRDGTPVRTLTGHDQPGGVAATGNRVGVIDVRRNDITVYDAESLSELGRAPAGAGPTHVVADRRGRLWVTDTRGNAVRAFELAPRPRQVSKLALTGGPYGVSYDRQRDRLWVTLTGRNEVVGIDLRTAPATVRDRLPTVRQPNTVAVDSRTGRLFITGTKDGVLQLVDP